MATYIGQVALGGSNLPVASTLYGTCATAAGTAAKVVTCDNFDKLITGVTIYVKFTNSNSVANPTLQVNSTDAKSIKRYGTTAPSTSAATSWQAGSVVAFTYDGTYWQMVGWLNNNDMRTAASAAPLMDGTAAVGTSTKYAREDHVHPTDTSRAPLDSPALTGTPTAPTPEASSNDTSIATTAFVYNAFTANDAMIFKGVVNANADLPTTHYQGWTYRVGTAGTYANKTCEVGDMIICVTDGTAANNDHWVVIQNNVDAPLYKDGNTYTGSKILLSDGTGGIVKEGTISSHSYTPAGSVTVTPTVTVNTTTVNSITAVGTLPSHGADTFSKGTLPSFTRGTFSQGTLPSHAADTFSAGTLPSFTRGTFSTGTLPSLSMSVTNEVLSFTWSAGTLPSHAADTFSAGTLPSYTQGTFSAGTLPTHAADTFSAGTLPSFTQGTFSAGTLPTKGDDTNVATGINTATATASFTGTAATLSHTVS